MAHTTTPERLITGDELFEMGDIGPCELVEGRIVRMTRAGAEHGLIEATLGRLLGNFVAERKTGWVFTGDVGVYTRRAPDTVRGADVAFVSRARLPRPGIKYLEVVPELVAEILSPEDRPGEVRRKIDEYFAIGIERVWIVNPKKRIVTVHRSPTDTTTLGEADILRGEGVLEGFELPVASLFAE